MTRLASARPLTLLALLVASSCGRTGLVSEWTEPGFGEGALDGGGSGGAVGVAGTGGSVPSGVGGGAGGGPGRGGGGGMIPVGARGGGGGTAAGRGGKAGAGKSGAAGKPPSDDCGDGTLDPGEECDAGEGPYAHPAIELHSNGIFVDLVPVSGDSTAYEYYAYYDESSHTGNENVSGSKIYFYRPAYESSVYLIVHHGIDFDATGFVQPNGKVTFAITSLPASSYVLVSDDEGEVMKDSDTSVVASWEFGQNTDGCVLGGLPFPGNWHVKVAPSFLEGIDSFTALSGDGYRTGLALPQKVELIASDEPGGCRRDCTLPRCGDGRLDAGETCDDGNDQVGDGCTECEPDGLASPP